MRSKLKNIPLLGPHLGNPLIVRLWVIRLIDVAQNSFVQSCNCICSSQCLFDLCANIVKGDILFPSYNLQGLGSASPYFLVLASKIEAS